MNKYYRIKEKALSGALEALKNSRKKKDAEKERLKKETERLRNIILSQAEEIDLLKKDQLGLLGPISGYRLDTYLKKELFDIVENSFFPAKRSCGILGLKPKRFYCWRKNYMLFGINGLIDGEPVAKIILTKLITEMVFLKI